MKSLTAVCQTGASMPAINPNGRIARHPPQRADGENAEMKMYLSKLKDLVPFMPKNRKLSKLEIIQHVIDYICDLQTELETHPEINNFDATAALNVNNNNNSNNNNSNPLDITNRSRGLQQEDVDMSDDAPDRLQHAAIQYNRQHQLHQQPQSSHSTQQSSPLQRQPLADRQTPNTILPPATNTSISTIQHQRAQILVSASSASSGHIPATYSTGSNNINSATTASHNSSAAIPTATVNNSSAVQLRMPEKNLDNSRQQSPTVLDEKK